MVRYLLAVNWRNKFLLSDMSEEEKLPLSRAHSCFSLVVLLHRVKKMLPMMPQALFLPIQKAPYRRLRAMYRKCK